MTPYDHDIAPIRQPVCDNCGDGGPTVKYDENYEGWLCRQCFQRFNEGAEDDDNPIE